MDYHKSYLGIITYRILDVHHVAFDHKIPPELFLWLFSHVCSTVIGRLGSLKEVEGGNIKDTWVDNLSSQIWTDYQKHVVSKECCWNNINELTLYNGYCIYTRIESTWFYCECLVTLATLGCWWNEPATSGPIKSASKHLKEGSDGIQGTALIVSAKEMCSKSNKICPKFDFFLQRTLEVSYIDCLSINDIT